MSCVYVLSSVQLFEILWTVALQAPLSMVFSMNNTAVGCHFFLQGIFPTRGEPRSPALQADFLPPEPPGKPEDQYQISQLSRSVVSDSL